MMLIRHSKPHGLNLVKAILVVLLMGLLPPWLAQTVSGSDGYLPIVTKSSNVFYVAPDGLDTNPGTLTAPWKTPQHAAEAAPVNATVYLRSGYYHPFTIQRDYLTFAAYPGETAIITGDGQEQHTIMVRESSSITLRDLTIQDNPVKYGTGIHVEGSYKVLITSNLIRSNQGFGIVIKDTSYSIVEFNELTDNANAIEVRYGSSGVMLRNNRIHHNQRILDSGRGGMGINFYRATGPVTADGNWLWENHTPELPDPGGSAFEVYAASNITISRNVIWDNETVLETGTDEEKTPCQQITFTRNLAYRVNRQQGLILRCASNSLIAHNTFDSLDNFVFDISHFKGEYGASVEGLRILNNLAVYGRVYAIETALPDSVVIDHNLAYNPGSESEYGDYLAYVEDFGNTDDLTEFQSWTGYEANGLSNDPRFVDYSNANYHLESSSPAIDQGVLLSESFLGSAPDLGRYEYSSALSSKVPRPPPSSQLLNFGDAIINLLVGWLTR